MCAAKTFSVDTRERAIREPGIGSSARQITPEEQPLSAGEAAAIRPATFLLPCSSRSGPRKVRGSRGLLARMLHPTVGGAAFVAFAYRVDVERAPADAATLPGIGPSPPANSDANQTMCHCPTTPFSRRPTFWLSYARLWAPQE
ncbi:hypothetical protein MRX96_019063 [Rhipicephalus microplus]